MAKFVIKGRQFKRDSLKFDTFTLTSEDGKKKYSLGINNVDKLGQKTPFAIAVEIDVENLSTSKRVTSQNQVIDKVYVDANNIKILDDQSLVAKLNQAEVNKLFN